MEAGEEAEHEGAGTAAKRLIPRMIDLYGNGFFHRLATDAYYSNKPFQVHEVIQAVSTNNEAD